MRHKASRLEIKIRKRANTGSIVAAAAYCAGGRYRCDRTGRLKNYSRRRDVVSVESIKMPHDPERLWNLACAAEKHPRARLAREILVSLPHELPLETQRVLVRGFCLWLHDRYGISSMAAIHHPLAQGVDDEVVADMIPQTEGRKKPAKLRKHERGNALNHHVYILCPTRVWDENTQSFAKKIRGLDDVKTGPGCVRQIREEWRGASTGTWKRPAWRPVWICAATRRQRRPVTRQRVTPQPKLGSRNAARGRRREQEAGRDDTFLGQARAKARAATDELWKSWLILRDAEREKARLEKSQRIASETEEARRAATVKAETKIDATETAAAGAEAIEAAPHLDALDPQKAAIAWAEGRLEAEIDRESDKTIAPETEAAATPKTGQPPKFVMSEREKKRARPPCQSHAGHFADRRAASDVLRGGETLVSLREKTVVARPVNFLGGQNGTCGFLPQTRRKRGYAQGRDLACCTVDHMKNERPGGVWCQLVRSFQNPA
ncbi:MobA/MobL family protein [Sagittula salina]|uniref:MobA/MobL family protein n=1 Tax=Sagittula salina TaxID=2820268 RepID=A0A940S3K1_9RHOB|nr:MobA/MobL family protein [Sagittula salina]MBP0485177.1 MobA/MobL family protein [Sagittula salina]